MFATIRVDNWDEACAIGGSLQRWGFRGQADENWALESTLLRARELYGVKPEWINHREYWMLRQFQRRFSAYLGAIPTPTSKLDWLAVMQHYGSATRLLDFSHSFYVAAFFAMERAAGNAAVWAVSQPALARRIAQFRRQQEASDDEQRNANHAEFAEGYVGLDKEPVNIVKFAVPVEPEFLHDRLITQQGFFLCPLDIRSSFVANLEASFGLPENALSEKNECTWNTCASNLDRYAVLKIVLPRTIYSVMAKDLHNMNIHSGTLFPGLDGYARSMTIHLRSFTD